MTSTLRDHRIGAGDEAHSPLPSDAQLDLLADFRSELQLLTATQRELLHELRSDGVINLDAEELPRLRQENADLRSRVEQLERMLRVAPAGEDNWSDRQTEYEKLLDEKSEVIRELHLKIQELKEAEPRTASPQEVHDAAVEEMVRELDEQRRQLEEDEKNLMQQVRTMEMALAKDRAELARQRTELQRQQADFTREVENASRDPQLHERLAILRPRHHDHVVKLHAEAPAAAKPELSAKGSGLIRRLFG